MGYNIKPGESFSFEKRMFTTNFNDKDGDSWCEVVLLDLPSASSGTILYKGQPVQVGGCFLVNDAIHLSFKRITAGAISEQLKFKISDNNQNKQYSNMATVQINIRAYVNKPPTSVGNLAVTIEHATTKTFSGSDFTTGLSPAYADFEGDAPSQLKVLSLPNSGTLKLNGIAVTINQDVPFSSIQGGLFTYVSNSSDTSAISTSFTFAMSDTGSGQFTS